MISSKSVMNFAIHLYLIGFFLYLFLPIAFMASVAFNNSNIPQAIPWEGFTLHWFAEPIHDYQLRNALVNSIIIATAVMTISVPVGLAGALLLTRIHFKSRNFLYAIMVSPILTPGIILGISTFLFWDRWFDVTGGLWTAIVGQTTFISSYCMLIIMARLQRFDRTLEDAAFDLGATHTQVFLKILLPFLKPAFWSSAALAFMQSFENYNTTLFAIGFQQTLPIYIGTKLRVFISPAINALAVILIIFTIAGTLVYEIFRERENNLKFIRKKNK